jgi:hypothetical protein
MKTRQSPRQTATVSRSHWLAYATASAATALAGSHFLEAAIHYSGRLDVRFPAGRDRFKAFRLDQPGDSMFFEHDILCGVARFGLNGIVSAAFRGYQGNFSYVSELSFGRNISTGEFAAASRGVMAYTSTCLTYVGPWYAPGTGYVGFRFNNGAGIQYGWARVTTLGPLADNAFRVEAYAYADPGEPIRAGQRSSSEEQAPEQGSLGWLGLGAVGLLAWRNSRSREVSS